MTKVVKFVATIEENTGRILNVEFPQATLTPESTKDRLTIVHVTEERMTDDFMQIGWNPMEYIWDGSEFYHVGKAPNRYATYNGTDWEWDQELLVEDVRVVRNRKLSESDWTQVSDSPLTEEQKSAWQSYRQELRDFMDNLPTVFSSVSELDWPVQPE